MLNNKQKKMAELNHNLIYGFLNRYKLSVDDYYDLAAIGLCIACMKFDDSKSKFSTFAYGCMFKVIFSSIRNSKKDKRNSQGKLVSYNIKMDDGENNGIQFIDMISAGEDVEGRVISKIMFNDYMDKLPDREREILYLLSLGYTQMQIAEILGCGQASVSRAYVKLCKYMIMDKK